MNIKILQIGFIVTLILQILGAVLIGTNTINIGKEWIKWIAIIVTVICSIFTLIALIQASTRNNRGFLSLSRDLVVSTAIMGIFTAFLVGGVIILVGMFIGGSSRKSHS